MFLVITLESYIFLLIQVPSKKQSRNFWGFQFVKHKIFGGYIFFLMSAVIACWNITEVNQTSEYFWMLSHFSISQSRVALPFLGRNTEVGFIHWVYLTIIFKGFIVRKRACYFENKNFTCQVSSPKRVSAFSVLTLRSILLCQIEFECPG